MNLDCFDLKVKVKNAYKLFSISCNFFDINSSCLGHWHWYVDAKAGLECL